MPRAAWMGLPHDHARSRHLFGARHSGSGLTVTVDRVRGGAPPTHVRENPLTGMPPNENPVTPLDDQPAAGRLASESLAYTVIDAAQNLLSLLVVPAALSWLSPAEMGAVTLALVGTHMVITIAVLGLDFAIVRFYLAWPMHRRRAHVAGILLLVTGSALILTAAAVASSLYIARPAADLVVAAVATGAGLAVRAVPLAVFRVTSDLRPYAVVAIGGSAAQAVFQIAMLAAGWGAVGFVAGGAVAAWLGALGAVLWLRPALRQASWPDVDARQLALWSLVGGMFNRAVASLDRIAVLVWSTIDMLGVYGTAARWSLPVRMVSGGAKLALAPALSREEHAGRLPDASAPLVAFVTLLAWMAVVLQLLSWCLVLTAWEPLAGEFQRLLSLLLAAQILGCISLIGQVLLYYAGRSTRSAGLAGLSAGLTVVGLVTLVPRFGARGAALAELCATAASLGVLVWAARGVRWGSPRLLRPLAVVTGTCAAPWFLEPAGTALVSLTGCLVLGRWVWSEARASGLLPLHWSSWFAIGRRRR